MRARWQDRQGGKPNEPPCRGRPERHGREPVTVFLEVTDQLFRYEIHAGPLFPGKVADDGDAAGHARLSAIRENN